MANTGTLRIILAGYSGGQAEDIKKILDSRNYITEKADSAEEALEYSYSGRFDMLLVNLLGEGINAPDIISKIRKSARTENLKIIALTPLERGFTAGLRVTATLYKDLNDTEELEKAIRYSVPGAPRLSLTLIAEGDRAYAREIKNIAAACRCDGLIVEDADLLPQKLSESPADLLIIDPALSGMKGFGILKKMRGDKRLSELPVIINSSLKINGYQECGALTGLPEITAEEIPPELLIKVIKELTDTRKAFSEERKPVVLIADDQPELLYIMKQFLTKSGFETVAAEDGKEALRAVFAKSPDIIVLDYLMPHKNGLEITKILKDNPLFAHIPIVICTGYSDKQTKLQGLAMGVDDYLIKPVDLDELIVRLKMILKRNKLVLDTNPLSKLPGNPSIQSRVEKTIQSGAKFAVLYLDLNNFKAYNDTYGFEAGDRVIKATANLLVKLTIKSEDSKDFIGHIGGDDFIIVTSYGRGEKLAAEIVSEYDKIAPSFYNETDRENGFIISTDRSGNIKKFPLVSISVGLVTNGRRKLESLAQISNIGAELKKCAKARCAGSCFVSEDTNKKRQP